LLSRDAVDGTISGVSPSDFFKPGHQFVFDAVRTLHRLGKQVDAVTVADEMGGLLEEVGGMEFILSLQNATPAISNAGRYAEIVVRTAQHRQLIAIAAQLAEAGYGETDLADAVESVKSALNIMEIRGGVKVDVITGRDFITAEPEPHDWVMPYVLERDDRLLLTGAEGAKKSLMLMQWAVMTACGTHWWTRHPVPAKRSLYLDLEIGRKRSRRRMELFAEEAGWAKSEWFDNLIVRSKPEDIDITTRAGASWLASLVEAAAPDVMFIGPIYRLTSGIAKAGDIGGEDQAKRAAFALDKIRERFGCALVAETHAAKGDSGRGRDLRPFGSSVWTRWPEFGYGIVRQSPEAAGFHPDNRDWIGWRGDRDVREWPSHFRWNPPGSPGWRMIAEFERPPSWIKALTQGNYNGVPDAPLPQPGQFELDDNRNPGFDQLDDPGEDF
jgi:replicative DNA helicase